MRPGRITDRLRRDLNKNRIAIIQRGLCKAHQNFLKGQGRLHQSRAPQASFKPDSKVESG